MASNKDKVEVTTGGLGFFGALTILFIGLKLTEHIDWPWLWVLSPLWIIPAIVLAFFATVGVILLVGSIIYVCIEKCKGKTWNDIMEAIAYDKEKRRNK